ncbi:MAG: site-specific DNA-methyltransferase [Desulfobacterales bacterium]|nr:site-specific DNA-methyltransferase [Desulfobacterales bacterium]
MNTTHRILFSDAKKMKAVSSESVDLMVTSPPYPMIQMWDSLFSGQSPAVKAALKKGDGSEAFERMHQVLDPVWTEVYRVLKTGGFACINIGDAVRTLNENFVLYPNHVRILQKLLSLGFTALPDILWRKQTNAPNKFMGSGMLPAGAYVTLEHEYILIVRKGPKRAFDSEAEKKNRRQSAVFWEERNTFFSDIWFDIKGAGQRMNNREARQRSAAYPFEVAYRLVNMYSVKGDTILDPFAGTGTTLLAAMAAGRNSLGYEIDASLGETIREQMKETVSFSNQYIHNRLLKHVAFVVRRIKEKGTLKYKNKWYGFPVMTAQEQELILNELVDMERIDKDAFRVTYSDAPQEAFCKNWQEEIEHSTDPDLLSEKILHSIKESASEQMKLF